MTGKDIKRWLRKAGISAARYAQWRGTTKTDILKLLARPSDRFGDRDADWWRRDVEQCREFYR